MSSLCDAKIIKRLEGTSDQASAKFNFQMDPVLFCKTTSVAVEKAKPAERIVLCTESRFCIFVKKALKPIELEVQHYLWDLESMKLMSWTDKKRRERENWEIQLKFKGNHGRISIVDNQASRIVQVLGAHFRYVWRDEDQPAGDAMKQVVESEWSDPRAFWKCVNFQAGLRRRALFEDFIMSVEQWIKVSAIMESMGSEPTLDMRHIRQASSYEEILFYALSKYPKFKQLTVPDWSAGGISAWDDLAAVIGMSPYLKVLVTYEPLTEKFNDVIDSAASNPSLALEELVFAGSKYDEKAMKRIGRMGQTCRTLHTLSFTGELGQNEINALAFEMPRMERIERLELLGMHELDLDELAINIPTLKYLNLTFCNVELYDLFMVLGKNQLSLVEINASGNMATRILPKRTKLNPGLMRFIMREIEWKNNNLIALMDLLAARPAGVCLDISKAGMSEEAWRDFDEFLSKQTDRVISEFIYDENRMSRDVITFLKNCVFLSSISMRGSLNASDDLVNDFGVFLRKNRKLLELHLTGSETCKLGPTMKKILSEIKNSRSIRVLDIRDQNIGYELLPCLADFFQTNTSVSELLCDGNQLLDIHKLDEFVVDMKKRGYKLNVHVPEKDILALVQLNDISCERIRDIVADIRSLGELEEIMPFSSVSSLTPACTVESCDLFSFMRQAYLDDKEWQEGLNFAPLDGEKFHYDRLNKMTDIDKLFDKVRTVHMPSGPSQPAHT